MSSLPASSEHRNSGKRDVIETFDPFRHYGANMPRFLNYVNRCLANRFRTIHSKHVKNPVCHAEPLFSSDVGEAESAVGEPEQALLERLNVIDRTSRKHVEDRLLIGEFVDFVRVENPRLLFVLGTMLRTGTQKEAARKLGVTDAKVGGLYRQITELGHFFLSRKARRRRSLYPVRRYGIEASESTTEPIPAPAPVSADLNITYWNRVDLYNEVWSKPLVKLSRKYGISDVRLGKVCRKLKIPHPGRGHWAKRAVNIAVEQPPLPEFKDAPVVRKMKTKKSGIEQSHV